MNRLDHLENNSIHILREAYAAFFDLAMLWSIGKVSTVLFWLARKALAGEIDNFTGISDPYEPPFQPDVVIKTDRETVQKGADKIIRMLEEAGYIPCGSSDVSSSPLS